MNDVKTCPKCSAKNPQEIKKCQLCGFEFVEKNQEENNWLSILRDSNQENETLSKESYPSDFNNKSQTKDEEYPNWLNNLRDNKEIEENFNAIQSNQPFKSDINEPLSNDSVENSQSSSELPDWLSLMRNDSVEPETTPDEEQELPTWLSKEPEHVSENDTNITPEEDSLPDWLTKLSENESPIEQIQSETTKSDPQPNWFKDSFDQDQDPNNEFMQQKEFSPFSDSDSDLFSADELPDWLNASSNNQEEQSSSQKGAEEPNWLSEINSLHEFSFEQNEIQPEKSSSDVFDSGDTFEFDEPDHFDQINFPEKQLAEKSPFPEDFSLDDLKFEEENQEEEELAEFSTENPFSKTKQPSQPAFIEDDVEDFEFPKDRGKNKTQPFKLEDMPDWLEDIDKIQSNEQDDSSIEIEKEPVNKIHEGNLPSWLKAMRPIGAVLPSEIRKEDKHKIEKSGPLAGLQGVLSSETIISQYSPPPTYATKIDITERNKLHASLLEDVFAQDKLRKPKVQKKSQLDYTITRIIIPLILIITLVLTFFNSQNQTKKIQTPRNYPAIQFASISNSISTSLGYSPKILVVFNGDAASIGETMIVSEKPMESFFQQNSWINILASNSTGLLVADQLISAAYQNVPSFNTQERVTTIGYLPGNDTGIQGFISNPRLLSQTISSGKSIWEKPGLTNITKIQDFNLIWIITDNAEYSQKWIEQLESVQYSNPILVSATKQSVPILSTFLDSGQIDGLIAGLQGATTYDEATFGNSGTYNLIWHEYQTGILIIMLIILSGIILQIINAVFVAKS